MIILASYNEFLAINLIVNLNSGHFYLKYSEVLIELQISLQFFVINIYIMSFANLTHIPMSVVSNSESNRELRVIT